MLTIRLEFPAGQYHATAWGRHVNEGVAEWPPSPYRLVRGLYDVWKRKCEDLSEVQVRPVLEALAETPPRFSLPRAVATHTRSYLNANSQDPTQKNLVFDPFLVFDREHACYLTWASVELGEEQWEVLDRLLDGLNYLGRSESWVAARRWTGAPDSDYLCDVTTGPEAEGSTEKVACPVPASEFAGELPWMDALTYSTLNLVRDKRKPSMPPAMRYVPYSVPSGAVMTDPPREPWRKEPATRYVMLGLDSTVLPLVTTSVEVADQIRVRLMGAHKSRMGGDRARVSPLFSGKGAEGKMRLDHGHLYIWPLGRGDGRIDRVLLFSPKDPFRADELSAVRGVRELWQSDGRPKVACVVTWQGAGMTLTEFAESRTFVSATPFVAPRHQHRRQDFMEYLQDEVRRECANHGLEAPVGIVLAQKPSLFEAVEYRRNRKGDPVRPGYFVRLTFERPVRAPFSIGYGAHFGLGLFRPLR